MNKNDKEDMKEAAGIGALFVSLGCVLPTLCVIGILYAFLALIHHFWH